jgi:two-component system, cell cycle sensor histidine kinase and response regulator CckA
LHFKAPATEVVASNRAHMPNRTTTEDKDRTRRPDPSRDLGDILDHLNAVVWEMDPDTWEFTYVSEYARRLVGYPIARWHQAGFWAERIHPEDRDRTVNECKIAIAAGEDHFLEYRMVHADGHEVWVRDSVRVDINNDGKATLVSGILFDITHLKQTEHAWRTSEQRFTRFAEASTECVIVHDNGKVLEVNDACTRMLGYTAEEMVGKLATEFCPPEDRQRLLAHIAKGSEDPLIGKALRKDGTTFDAELVGRNISLLGEATRVVTMRDISKRVSAEQALTAAELDYATLFDEVTEAIVLTDENLRILRINRSACEMSGLTDAQLRGRHLSEFIDPRELQVNPLQIDSLPRGESLRVERVLRSPTGARMVADISAKRLLDGRVLASVHDLTERRQAETRQRESALLLEKALRVSRDAVVLFHFRDELVLEVNEAWSRLTGVPRAEALGRTLTELKVWADEEKHQEMRSRLARGEAVQDLRLTYNDHVGGVRYGELSAEVLTMEGEACVLLIGRDITEQMRLERQLRQTQKLEAIGGVAGGIAHDFNNILTAIRAFSELAIGSLPHSNPAREDVTEILKATDRAIALTRQLLTFSRQEVQHVRTISVNDVINDVAPMLKRLAGDRCTIDFQLSSDAGLVIADPGQIEQVLVNLLINARDAMRKGGVITIVTSNASAVAPTQDRPAPLSGDYVVVSVGDTGVGIDDATRERMFEPFFTTKAASHGTGLGLSMVYGIVKQSGGAIDVVSEVGKGSTFRILLPRVQSS